LIVPIAYNEGILSEPTFSIYLTSAVTEEDNTGDSYIDFGTPVLNGGTPLYIDVVDNDPWWSATLNGIYFEDDPSTLYMIDAKPALTDSGSSLISGPYAEVMGIRKILKTYLSTFYNVSGWGPIFPCSDRSNMPNFYLSYGDYWFQVRPEDYAVKIDWTYDECAFGIDVYNDAHWILGASFMRGLYIVHDHTNMR